MSWLERTYPPREMNPDRLDDLVFEREWNDNKQPLTDDQVDELLRHVVYLTIASENYLDDIQDLKEDLNAEEGRRLNWQEEASSAFRELEACQEEILDAKEREEYLESILIRHHIGY